VLAAIDGDLMASGIGRDSDQLRHQQAQLGRLVCIEEGAQPDILRTEFGELLELSFEYQHLGVQLPVFDGESARTGDVGPAPFHHLTRQIAQPGQGPCRGFEPGARRSEYRSVVVGQEEYHRQRHQQ